MDTMGLFSDRGAEEKKDDGEQILNSGRSEGSMAVQHGRVPEEALSQPAISSSS